MDTAQRYRGCLLGLAAGDAVGTALEFKQPGSFQPITDMIGGGPFHLAPGQWTDDTSMALCLAESLLVRQGFDGTDQLERYVRWWREGYLSSTGECFDIGNTTREALSRFVSARNPFSGSTDSTRAGNGSIMRLAPVPMYFLNDPKRAIEMAADSSRTTHGAFAAVDACRYLAALLIGALRGVSRQVLLSEFYCPVEGYWEAHPLVPEIREIASGSFRRKEPPAIQGSGYSVRSLEAALWAFHKSGNFRDGCLLAANLGDDADTTAAVYGQLAGAFYGEPGIPQQWLDRLALRDTIAEIADRLCAESRRLLAGAAEEANGAEPVLRSGQKSDAAAHEHFLKAEVQRAAEQYVMPAPFDRSYWVLPGKFLAGAYPGDPDPRSAERKLSAILAAGIRCFVDLTSEEDRNLFGQFLVPYQDLAIKIAGRRFRTTYRRMPIADLQIPSHTEMAEILDLIDGAILSQLPVYVHCLGGVGRTGTVVGCWLARHGIAQGVPAINLIRKLRRHETHAVIPSPETGRQRQFICDWEKGD